MKAAGRPTLWPTLRLADQRGSQSHHFRSSEELDTTLQRCVWLCNRQFPQSAPGKVVLAGDKGLPQAEAWAVQEAAAVSSGTGKPARKELEKRQYEICGGCPIESVKQSDPPLLCDRPPLRAARQRRPHRFTPKLRWRSVSEAHGTPLRSPAGAFHFLQACPSRPCTRRRTDTVSSRSCSGRSGSTFRDATARWAFMQPANADRLI